MIHPTARIADTAIVGAPFRPLLDGRLPTIGGTTEIGAAAWIGHFTTIGQGATIGAGSILEEYVQIQAGAELGEKVLVTSRSHIGIGVKIAEGCVIRGHVGDFSQIGKGCRIAGQLVHRQLDPTVPWDDPSAGEPSPMVGDGAFVGWGAVVIGGVNIGAGAYVCARALITKDVPAGHIALDRNKIIRPEEWHGALMKSPFFAVGPAADPVPTAMVPQIPARPERRQSTDR